MGLVAVSLTPCPFGFFYIQVSKFRTPTNPDFEGWEKTTWSWSIRQNKNPSFKLPSFQCDQHGAYGEFKRINNEILHSGGIHVFPIHIDQASKVMSRFLVLFHCDQNQKKPIIFTKLLFSRCSIQAAGVVFVIQQEMPAPIPFTALCRTDHGVSTASSLLYSTLFVES
jgi:hypothetical protein